LSIIKISINTQIPTANWEIGKAILEAFLDTSEKLFPEFVSWKQPVRTPVKGVEECQEYWAPVSSYKDATGVHSFATNMLWKRASALKSDWHVMHTSSNNGVVKLHGVLLFSIRFNKSVDFFGLFKKLCQILNPEVATLHLFTDIESQKNPYPCWVDRQVNSDGVRWESDPAAGDFFAGALHPEREESIPNLPWSIYFGAAIRGKFDEKQVAASGALIEELNDGLLLRVSSEISEVEKDFPAFSERRARIKSHFPKEMFVIKREPVMNFG